MFPTINNKIILIAALDWGLGHATRCIPIIENYLSLNKKVVIAGSSSSGQLLRKYFPNLTYYELPAYNVIYSNGTNFTNKMFRQIPKILNAIKHENKFIQTIISKENIQSIISDNRYGVYKKGIQNIIVCHQLKLNSPYLSLLVNTAYHNFFMNFDECWIPDFDGLNVSLAGELSHPQNFGIPVCYLGPISRFKKLNLLEDSKQILVLLSGPEPQRSILEDILYTQINKLTHYKWFILRGTETKPNSALTNNDNVVVKNLLDEINLEQLIAQSKLIICRAGYTSIMDFILLNKKAILIPTPGQWEQEYLATWNSKNNNFLFVNQYQLDLKENIAQLIAN